MFMAVTDKASVQAMAKLHAVGYQEDDVYLHCAPLFHVGGLSSMVAMLAVGATQARRQLPHHLQLPVNLCAVQPVMLKHNDSFSAYCRRVAHVYVIGVQIVMRKGHQSEAGMGRHSVAVLCSGG